MSKIDDELSLFTSVESDRDEDLFESAADSNNDDDDDDGKEETKKLWRCDSVMQNVVLLGCMIFCIYFAFNVTQAFAGKVIGADGIYALAVNYVAFGLFSLVAPFVIGKIGGARRSLGLGALMFVIYLPCNLYPHLGLLVPASILLGCGGSLMWCAHGVFLSAHGDESSFGLYSGVFFAIYMVHLIFGNLFAALFFRFTTPDENTGTIFVAVLSAVCALSLVCWWFLKDPPKKKSKDRTATAAVPTTRQRLLATIALSKDRFVLALLPAMLWTGFSQTFYYFIVTNEISAKDEVGFVMTVFGVGEVVSAFVSGPLGDRVGRVILLNLAMLLGISGTICVFFYRDPALPTWVRYVCGFVFGATDTMSYNALYGLLPQHVADVDAAFGFWKLSQCLFYAILLFLTVRLEFVVMASLFIANGAIGILCSLLLVRMQRRV
jgi:MFS family permease